MSTEAIHGETELLVFREFAEKANIGVIASSIEKRPLGEPDILCSIEGEGPVAFELAELCAEDVAAAISNIKNGGVAVDSTSDPSATVLRRKLRKTYQSHAPIELLLYTNARLVTPDDLILSTLRPMLDSHRSRFRKVWLLGEKGTYEVWRAS